MNSMLLFAAEGVTFGKAWGYGGFLMWVLVIFSILSVAVMIYLGLSQRKDVYLPEALARIRTAKDPAAEGSRLAERLNSAVDWLADIAAIAPLIGLLGTVLGIFDAFSAMDDPTRTPAEKTELLTHGVSKAVVTTVFGLVISIPSLIAHAIYRRRAAALVASMEELAEYDPAAATPAAAPAKESDDAVHA